MGARGLATPQEPGRAACKKWAPYLSPRWFETRKTCNRFSCPSAKSLRVWAAYTRIAHRCQRSDTACNNAVRNCTSDISRQDRNQLRGPRHSSNNARVLPSPPSSACAGRGGPSLLEGRPAAACDLGLSFRVFLVSRHHDSRGDRTCDPQTPPSVSRSGL